LTTINLSSLKVPQSGERKVRDFINTPQGQIEIYEPTISDADAILELQREEGFDFNQEQFRFDATLVLKKLFPLLTNIETAELSDEEIQNIAENPSVHLLIAQNYVAQIISEVNKLYAERIKAEIASADSMMAQAELISSIPSMILEQAKTNPEVAEMVQKVEEKTKELEESIDQEEKESDVDGSKI
jgi:hypothetical protein